jgi:hypothetical protein
MRVPAVIIGLYGIESVFLFRFMRLWDALNGLAMRAVDCVVPSATAHKA